MASTSSPAIRSLVTYPAAPARRERSTSSLEFEPVSMRTHVHQSHVRLEAAGPLDRLRAIAGLANDGDPVVGREDGDEGLDEQLVVVDDEHANASRQTGGSFHFLYCEMCPVTVRL
jgi:hypothetical protein